MSAANTEQLILLLRSDATQLMGRALQMTEAERSMALGYAMALHFSMQQPERAGDLLKLIKEG